MKPIKPKTDVVPLSEFRANVSELLKQTQETGRPIVITQHGRGAAVLISADDYAELLDRMEYINSVSRALARSARGEKGIPHEKVMADARALVEKMKQEHKANKRKPAKKGKKAVA